MRKLKIQVNKVKNKRGISPVIATVLLIVVAIALFLLIFLWLRGFQKEAIMKFGTPIETACLSLRYDANYNGGTLQLTNTGSTTIYKVKVYVNGTYSQPDISTIMPTSSGTKTISGCRNIKVIPYLLGTTKAGTQKEYACEKQAKIISC